MTRRASATAAFAAIVALAWAPPTAAISTPDGTAVAFNTYAALTPDDQDSELDAYVWREGTVELVSIGPTGGQGDGDSPAMHISEDGERVLFSSGEELVPDDDDGGGGDVYVRHGGTTELVTTGPADQPGGFVDNAFATADGERVFFTIWHSVMAEDTDDHRDIYMRTASGVTTLVSTDPAGTPATSHWLRAISPDGQRVFEDTDARLSLSDRDLTSDVYERSSGTAKLVTRGGPTDLGDWPAVFEDATPSGDSILFRTNSRMTTKDLDDRSDYYQRIDGKTRLVTANSDGFSPPCTQAEDFPFPPCYTLPDEQSDDGGHVVFTTREPLVPEDADADLDAYERTATGTRLLSATPAANGSSRDSQISADGSRAIVATTARLVAADTDSSTDAYAWEGGTPTLLSGGSSADVLLSVRSRDAERAYFRTDGALVPEDTDGGWDLYLNEGSGPELVTTGPADDGTNHLFTVQGTSDDGARLFFTSKQQLVAEDTDNDDDLYMHSGGVTTLESG